jgi:hypothetical protein
MIERYITQTKKRAPFKSCRRLAGVAVAELASNHRLRMGGWHAGGRGQSFLECPLGHDGCRIRYLTWLRERERTPYHLSMPNMNEMNGGLCPVTPSSRMAFC